MENGLLFQGFEWEISADGNYYKDLIGKLDELKEIGVTAIWLPPVCKATSTNDNGYGTYDLFDLGEFDQKGAIRTKYGTKKELKELIAEIHKRGLQVYADVVINHKAGADRTETFKAVMVDQEDRSQEVEDPKEIDGWTAFDFPGRGDQYSDFKWNFNHFIGVDYDQATETKAIFRILGEDKGWSLGVSNENGNFDYLMFADIDHAHPAVKEELKKWAIWFIDELNLDGFRLDAVKHIDAQFIDEFLIYIRSIKGKNFYFLGEFWRYDPDSNTEFLNETNYDMDLFDVTLHFNLLEASEGGSAYDLRKIFDNTVTTMHPELSVPFVNNHDSQPGQALESFIKPWFIEIAYGIIFLRKDGYPCLFYGDYYGISGPNPQDGFKEDINRLAHIRKKFSYGDQDDYFDHRNCIGWVRHGNENHPYKCAVIISNEGRNQLKMLVGKEQASNVYADYIGNSEEKITIDEEGYGVFTVAPGSISVWIENDIPL